MIIRSDSIDKIAPALCAAQTEFEAAIKGSENPYFKSKYADLAEILRVTKMPLNKNGIAIMQPMSEDKGKYIVSTLLIHSSTQLLGCQMALTTPKPDMQSLGSAISYARRYTLQSLLGIPTIDDDANKASGNYKQTKEEREFLHTIYHEVEQLEKAGLQVKAMFNKFLSDTWTYKPQNFDAEDLINLKLSIPKMRDAAKKRLQAAKPKQEQKQEHPPQPQKIDPIADKKREIWAFMQKHKLGTDLLQGMIESMLQKEDIKDLSLKELEQIFKALKEAFERQK